MFPKVQIDSLSNKSLKWIHKKKLHTRIQILSKSEFTADAFQKVFCYGEKTGISCNVDHHLL